MSDAEIKTNSVSNVSLLPKILFNADFRENLKGRESNHDGKQNKHYGSHGHWMSCNTAQQVDRHIRFLLAHGHGPSISTTTNVPGLHRMKNHLAARHLPPARYLLTWEF